MIENTRIKRKINAKLNPVDCNAYKFARENQLAACIDGIWCRVFSYSNYNSTSLDDYEFEFEMIETRNADTRKTEYAFPQGQQVGSVSVSEGGITLRDYFAAKALQGLLHDSENCSEISDFAEFAYVFADAMLDARK